MRSYRGVRRGIAVCAASLALGAGAITPALAGPTATSASTPAVTWKTEARVGPSSQYAWTAVSTEDGAKDAWTVLSTPVETVLEHWNGSAWQQVSVPALQDKFLQYPSAIGASSSSNVWIFGYPQDSEQVLRKIGSKWTVQATPDWVARTGTSLIVNVVPAVFSPKDVWVFSLDADTWTTVDNYAAFYNGTTWSKRSLPGVPGFVSAVSANDIWMLAATVRGGSEFLTHWTGSTWKQVALPKATVPKGGSVGFMDLSAFGTKNVWAVESIHKNDSDLPTLYLVHWNGSAWSRISFEYPANEVEDIKSDGSGGVWLWAYSTAKGNPLFVYHVHGSSQWKYSAALPSQRGAFENTGDPGSIEWIPGSNAVWAVTNQWSTPVGDLPAYAVILKATV
jgi:hypothetical protein